MCGIFGVVGKEDGPEIVFAGLKELEYRGYDSWGIAWKEGASLKVQKKIGKLPESISLPKSTLAIGHTRWATHGGVTDANAHPHLSCDQQIAVVHNGIIENFRELKEELVEKGHKFLSETDTEIIPHLIEENLKTEGFATSVRNAFRELKGLNAIVVANSSSKEIIAAKNGSPLVAGVAEGALFVASDAPGLLEYTRQVLFLSDNQMIVLGDKLQLIDLVSGEKIDPKIETLNWKFEQAQKGEFLHYMLKEIHEQPVVVENIVKNYQGQIEELAELVKNARGTFLIGCGTASYVALAGQYLFSRIADQHVNFSIGSEFNYLEHYLNEKSLIIAISQSGETIDVVEPFSSAKKKGAKTVAITNVLGSSLYRMADFKLLLGAGPEVGVCATKSFIAMAAILIYLTYEIAGKSDEAKKLLSAAAENISAMLEENYVNRVKELASQISKKEHLYLIGRGLSYAAALEGSLKLKEVPYIHSEGFAGGELKHGVIALVEKGTPVIVFAPNDETKQAIISNAIEIKARGGYIIGISPENNPAFDYHFPVADLSDATILPSVVVAQLLSYYSAINKGLDPDKPRNLAKSVTVK